MIAFNHSITNVNKFADRLRHARQLRGFTQASLARACGLSQSAIANYETKNRETAKDIFKLADALRVNAVWLGQGIGPMESTATLTGLPEPSNATVADVTAAQMSRWPFTSIAQSRFWSLSEDKRLIIEDTVATLIASLERG